MSVLIKGMDMPTGCYTCPILQGEDGGVDFECPFNAYLHWHDTEDVIHHRPDSCPLIEVPTPRGRLIDADELIERIERFRDIHNYYPADIDATMRWFINQICGAKTIIEAENSSAIDDDVKKYCDYLKSETYDFCNRIENGEVSEE